MAQVTAPTPALGVSAAFIRDFFGKVPLESSTQEACENVVKKETAKRKCAYIDLLEVNKDSKGRPLVSKATVYVSHAWSCKFRVCCEVMLAFAEQHPESYFWFDLFVVNQHDKEPKPQEWWTTSFKRTIAETGSLLLVMSPLINPVPPTRAWCLWEMACAVEQRAPIYIRLPPSDQPKLMKALMANFKGVMDALSRIQSEKSDASVSRDKDMIFAAIKSAAGGFVGLNQRVKQQIREWLLETTRRIFVEMEKRNESESKEFKRLCHNIGSYMAVYAAADGAFEQLDKSRLVNQNHHVLNSIGVAFSEKGEYDRAIQFFERCLVIKRSLYGDKSSSTAGGYNNIASAYYSKGDFDRAIQYFEKSLAIRQETLGEKHPDTAASYNNIGTAYRDKDQHDKAIQYFEKSLAIRRETLGENNPATAASYNNIASTYYSKKEYDRAIQYFEKSLAIKRETLGENHPDTATSYNNIGTAFNDKGQFDKAIEYYHKALAIRRPALGEDHPSTISTYDNIANAYDEKGDFENSLVFYQKSLAIQRANLGEKNIELVEPLGNVAAVLLSKGDYDRAIEMYERILALQRAFLGESHAETASTYLGMADGCKGKGDTDRALRYLERALEIQRSTLGESHPDTQKTRQEMNDCRAKKPSGLPQAKRPEPRPVSATSTTLPITTNAERPGQVSNIRKMFA